MQLMYESKFPFVSRIEFIRSKLSNFSAHVSGLIVLRRVACFRPGAAGAETGAGEDGYQCAVCGNIGTEE